MSRIDLPAAREAKFVLSFCYRNGLIGSYRRKQTSWIVHCGDRKMTLDDGETVRFLKHCLESTPSLVDQLAQERSRSEA